MSFVSGPTRDGRCQQPRRTETHRHTLAAAKPSSLDAGPSGLPWEAARAPSILQGEGGLWASGPHTPRGCPCRWGLAQVHPPHPTPATGERGHGGSGERGLQPLLLPLNCPPASLHLRLPPPRRPPSESVSQTDVLLTAAVPAASSARSPACLQVGNFPGSMKEPL